MIRVEDRSIDSRIRLVTIDRQDRRNAVDLDALDGLLDAIATAATPSTRVLILTGAGGHFCAGADLKGLENSDFALQLRRVLSALRDAPFPTLAAVEGAALGAGTQFAVACDLRISTADATFGIPAAKLGLMVDQWTIDRVVSLAGQGPARATFLAAETFSGEQAFGFGFVQRIGALQDAIEWAEVIAALAPLTIAGHKVGVNDAEVVHEPSPAYAQAFERAWASGDLQEGISAFRERRAPVFRGE